MMNFSMSVIWEVGVGTSSIGKERTCPTRGAKVNAKLVGINDRYNE
jgi:hypothetical protein